MPNIDRDDENATRYETKPTIDEQIAHQEASVAAAEDYGDHQALPKERSILSTLRAHKAIMEAKRPEPVAWMAHGGEIWNTPVSPYKDERGQPLYGPDLLAYADRMAAERDRHMGAVKAYIEDSEHLSRQLAELQAKHDALVKRLTEAVCPHCNNTGCVEGSPVAVCCNRPLPNGECCGSPVPEQTQEQCQWCAERESMSVVSLKGGE